MKSDAFDKRHVPHAKKYATQFSFALLSEAEKRFSLSFSLGSLSLSHSFCFATDFDYFII